MGEYATYRRQSVKIGTCQDMYYLRFDQRRDVRPESGNVDPVKDAGDLRFRFPWPDEDHIAPGGFQDYDRSVVVLGFAIPDGVEHYGDCTGGGLAALVRQRYLPALDRLVPILKCTCRAMWREEDMSRIEEIAVLLRSEADRRPDVAPFYHAVADRVLSVTPNRGGYTSPTARTVPIRRKAVR